MFVIFSLPIVLLAGPIVALVQIVYQNPPSPWVVKFRNWWSGEASA